MSTSPEVHQVADIHDLLSLLELKGIKFFAVSGRLVTDPREDTTDFGMEVVQRQSPVTFEARFKMTVTSPQADYVIDVASRYESPEPIAFSPQLAAEFIERVAVMAVFPFLREGLASSASRLEVPVPILGLLRPGQFKIELKEEVASGEE